MEKVNILGSCVSRVSMLDGNQQGHNIADENLDMVYFLDKQNIACAMTPAPFSREEVDSITEAELWDKSRIRTLKQAINKDTVSLLLESDANWLVMDLFDMQNDFAVCNDTMFSTCAHEFFNTKLYKKYAKDVQISNFMNIPKFLWYGYVDLFFEKIMTKYDSDHIILNRFRSNTYYLDKDGEIKLIPDNFKMPYQSNDKYNFKLNELESYIIKKYNPYVIDLSKYYMGDKNVWDNLNGAHFEKSFYYETFEQVKRIINGESKKKYYSEPNFFNDKRKGYEEENKRAFNIESALQLINKLIDEQDILWLNVLDKLNIYAPNDERVKQYLGYLSNAVGE